MSTTAPGRRLSHASIELAGLPITFAYVGQRGTLCKPPSTIGWHPVANGMLCRKSLKMLVRLNGRTVSPVPLRLRLRYIQRCVARALWGDEVINGAVPERASSGLNCSL